MSAIDAARTRELLQEFQFNKLFREELGWNGYNAIYDIPIDGQLYHLKGVAEKKGVQVFECTVDSGVAMPAYSDRQKIDRWLTKPAFLHLIIFTDTGRTQQIWQWVSREKGKPAAYREYKFYKGQSGESIVQKLGTIAFSINEEDSITVVGAERKLKDAFDRDRVTKKFYDRFKKEHDAFLKLIEGIPEENLHKWYASVMINRLMFVYFIQKKGFLNGDEHYLRNKLKESGKGGKDRFYLQFLSTLFFEGFAKEESDRSGATNKLLGKIPYLNGGLFLKHDIEKKHGKNIRIRDSAFQKLFAFFDEYEWHLDARPLANDKEINPDVLGYIFEKYINQKELGAYYTKEDITEYISKNTIIPYLFDFAKTKCKIAFEGENSVWNLLKESPDTYIYEPVKRGVIDKDGNVIPESRLPDFVRKGMHDPKARMFEKRYNLGEADFRDDAGNKLSLPTETWREYVERRNRCLDVRKKLQAGEVTEINDLITYNLDIRQFAQDVIESSEGPDLLNAFWHGIKDVKILDPTVGSGAFLFAAVNILEPLYETSLDRMEVFLDEWGESAKKIHPNYYKEFKGVLDNVGRHANREYFIYKSIIINNLYGVDILDEAVEICKLRLFLKLAAQVDPDDSKPNYGIEPLPDIDFNVKAGNTLVGYTSLDEIKKAMPADLIANASMNESLRRIEEKAADIENLFGLFRQQQTELGGEIRPADKEDLRGRLFTLEGELNRYLCGEYGIDSRKKSQFENWLGTHKPFHWHIDFYGIVKGGGFDVIIGNPPYVEYSKVLPEFSVHHYKTLDCRNLYAFVLERTFALLGEQGRSGFIVPLPSINTSRMKSLQMLIKPRLLDRGRSLWVSSYDERPSNLFSGVDQRLVIELFGPISWESTILTTGITRWASRTRGTLFSCLSYANQSELARSSTTSILKIRNSRIEDFLLKALYANRSFAGYRTDQTSGDLLAYRTAGGRYWKVVSNRPFDEGTLSAKVSYLSGITGSAAVALISSSAFWWYYSSHFDMYNLKDYMIFGFRFSDPHASVVKLLTNLGDELISSLDSNAKWQQIHSKTRGTVRSKVFVVSKSKGIIDEIDSVLAKHFEFTDEELDFIINYDIKYRMGNEGAGGEEE